MSEETAIEKKRTVMDSLEPFRDQITQALAKRIDTTQFMRVAANVWEKDEFVRKCDWRTFVLAVCEAAEAGLIINGVAGECYIIPRYSSRNGRWEANFQLGYRGAMKLARRGGEVLDIMPELVYENDEFHEVKGTKREIHHVPWYCLDHDEKGEIRLAYSVAQMRNGIKSYRVIDRGVIDKAAAMSGKKSEPMSHVWRDHFDEMSLKTAIHRHAKFLPIPDREKSILIRDMYRLDGVESSFESPFEDSITVEQVPDEITVELEPGLVERKALESAMGKAWRRAEKFCKQAGVQFSREKPEPFYRLVMWLVGDPYSEAGNDSWPESKGDRIALLEAAITQLDKWEEAGEEGRALCMEFSQYNDAGAAYDLFGDDEPFADFEEKPVDPAKDDEAFEASQGGER